MGVSIHTSKKSFEIGSGAFLGAFFDTIYVRLSKGFFGKRFPFVLGELYYGELKYENINNAKKELEVIHSSFKKYSPDKVVWDKEDLNKRPPWGDNISPEITDLSNYFVTSDGKDIFDVLFNAMDTAIEEKSNLTIR